MICKPEEAKNFKCCVMEKDCEGSSCMAWEWAYEEDESVPNRFPRPPAFKKTGLGYCGLVK